MSVPASRCARCGRASVPRRARCPACAGPVEDAEVPARGALVSWTVVRAAPAGLAPGYVVGLVRLGDALALAAGESADGLDVDAPVEVRAEGERLVFRLTR